MKEKNACGSVMHGSYSKDALVVLLSTCPRILVCVTNQSRIRGGGV